MAVYTWRAYDLMTNRFLMDLPVLGGSYTEALNDPGSFSLTVPLSPRVRKFSGGSYVDAGALYNTLNWDVQAIYNAVTPGRTAIFVDRDGVLVWGGIVWTRRPQNAALEIGGNGFLSYFARRRIRQDFDRLGTEQCEIARTYLNYATGVTYQGRAVGNIGIAIDATTNSGVIRDSLVNGSDRKFVLDTVMELVNLSNGFDLDVSVAYDPQTGAPTKRLSFFYPHKGRLPAETTLVWEYEAGLDVPGGTIASYDWPEDGSRMLTLALGRGDTSDFPVLSEQYADNMLALGWPLLEDEHTWSNDVAIEDQATLDEHTRAVLAVRGGLVTTPTVSLVPGVDPGAYDLGDYVRLNLTDPLRFPSDRPGVPGYSDYLRIIGRTVTPPLGDGQETTDITLHTLAAEQESSV
jgi:hypothetical protein